MSGKVLAVADSAESVRKVVSFLSTMGFSTRICTQPAEAVEFAAQMHPDVVVADDHLVELTGADLAREIRTDPRTQSLPFVLLARTGGGDGRPAPSETDISAVVTKPINAMSLYSTVSHLIGQDAGPSATADDHPSIATAHEAGERRGTITPMSLGRVLYHMHVHESTGILELHHRRRIMQLSVEGGVIRQVHSNYLRDDSLGRMLVRHGVITQREHEETRARARQAGARQGEILVAMGILDRDDLGRELHRQRTGKLYRLVATDQWIGGEYVWHRGSPLPPDDLPLDVSAVKLLRNAVLRRMSPALIFETFEKRNLQNIPLEEDGSLEAVLSYLQLPETLAEMPATLAARTVKEIYRDGDEDGVIALRLAFLLVICHGLCVGECKPERTSAADAIAHRMPRLDDVGGGEPKDYAGAADIARLVDEAEDLFQRREYRACLGVVHRINEKNPYCAPMLALLAAILVETGEDHDPSELAKAKELLTESLHIRPNDARAHFYLGMIYRREGHDMSSLRHMRTAVRLDPDNERARREIAHLESDMANETGSNAAN
ncbi:MAG: response regulator [Deltaproteobacteria bacterium]|nr:response regulator [Deltaproteobacteria bacterium]